MENKGKEEKPIVIFSFTEEGCRLNRKLNALLAKAGYKCGSYTTERFAAGFGMKTMDQDLKQWIGAVSYTHLDVYKRQAMPPAHAPEPAP